jgi:hypothetical protein
MGASEIIVEYARLRTERTGLKSSGRSGPKLLSQAEQYEQWCSKHAVDPLVFLQSRFAAFPPPKYPGLGVMCSDIALERFRKFREGRQLQANQYTRLKKNMDSPATMILRALEAAPTIRQEALRAHYRLLDNMSLCMVESGLTGGYDPRSKECPKCPIKHDCLGRLNAVHGFDVGALRVGVFNRLPLPLAEAARKLRNTGT